jgi:hypothetical protein
MSCARRDLAGCRRFFHARDFDATFSRRAFLTRENTRARARIDDVVVSPKIVDDLAALRPRFAVEIFEL